MPAFLVPLCVKHAEFIDVPNDVYVKSSCYVAQPLPYANAKKWCAKQFMQLFDISSASEADMALLRGSSVGTNPKNFAYVDGIKGRKCQLVTHDGLTMDWCKNPRPFICEFYDIDHVFSPA